MLACGVVGVIFVEKRNEISPIATTQTDVGQNETTNMPEQNADNIPSEQTPTLAVSNDYPSSTFLPGTKFAPEA